MLLSSSIANSDDAPQLLELNRRRRFATVRAIVALMLREMSTTYGRSPIGYLWAVLQPAAGIVLLTFVFSLMMRSPPLGNNFALFYATGLLPFMFFNDISNKLSHSVQFSRSLLIYPSVTITDALLARLVLNVLTQLMVAFVVFTTLILLYDTRASVNLPAIALSFAMVTALSAGLGVMNAFVFGVFKEWERIWAILSRPLLIVSCVMFVFDAVPEPYRGYLWYNPLVQIIGQMRHGFYPYYEAEYVSPSYVFFVSLVLLSLGLLFLKRFALFILNET